MEPCLSRELQAAQEVAPDLPGNALDPVKRRALVEVDHSRTHRTPPRDVSGGLFRLTVYKDSKNEME